MKWNMFFQRLLLVLPIPAAIVGLDLALRGRVIYALPQDFLAYYLTSCVFLLIAWSLGLKLLSSLQQKQLRLRAWFLALSMAGLNIFFLSGSIAFFRYFGILPNVFSFEYLLDEFRDSLIYARSMVHGPALLAGLAVVASVAAYAYWASGSKVMVTSLRQRLLHCLAMLLAIGFMHNNVRMGPNAFTPDVHAAFSLSKALENWVFAKTQVQVVGAGARRKIDFTLGEMPHNVLLLLNESMRAKNLGAFGYHRDTTPELSRFFKERADHVIRFPHAYANATRTMLAFPSFFSGVIPSDPGALMHQVPLVFDYARSFTNTKTFLISSQSMRWGNFKEFLGLDQLDYAYYKEVSTDLDPNADRFESIDDALLPGALERFFDKQGSVPSRFFGVIQLTGTHAPYRFDDKLDQLRGLPLVDDYDNALRYHDRQLGKILNQLKARGQLDNTLIIATSDHGEAFGEHGYFGHLNTFYDEEAKVPLWIHLPSSLAHKQNIKMQLEANAKLPVANADILPTAIGLSAAGHSKKIAKLLSEHSGNDLSRSIEKDRVLLMQNYNDIDEKTMFVGIGAVTGHYKYLLKLDNGRGLEELYDLANDPKETTNIWADAAPALKTRIHQAILAKKNSANLFKKAFPEYQAKEHRPSMPQPESPSIAPENLKREAHQQPKDIEPAWHNG